VRWKEKDYATCDNEGDNKKISSKKRRKVDACLSIDDKQIIIITTRDR
jgi:hypothetical protein